MPAGNGNKGYWKGYPSYLLQGRDRSASAMCEEPSENDCPQASRSAASGYWGSLEQAPSELRRVCAGESARCRKSQPQNGDPVLSQAGVLVRSHIIAGLLAIFLGCFGIHKFYLGYNSTGIVMLAVSVLGSFFTFGLAGMVMSVIGVVEGIIYLVTGQVAFDRIYVYNKKEWF